MWDIGNILFLKSHALKVMDLVKFKTAIIMFKARNIYFWEVPYMVEEELW